MAASSPFDMSCRLIDGPFFSIACSGRLGTCMNPAGVSDPFDSR